MKAWQRIVALLAPGHPARLALAEDVRQTPGGQARQTLLSMGLMRDSLAIVFVPPENSAFWTNYLDCRGDPFFVPAILGAPMLKGLNPSVRKCSEYPYAIGYGSSAASETSTDSQLCARAVDFGFTTVFILLTPATGRKIECGNLETHEQ